jgi:hypothetical protein
MTKSEAKRVSAAQQKILDANAKRNAESAARNAAAAAFYRVTDTAMPRGGIKAQEFAAQAGPTAVTVTLHVASFGDETAAFQDEAAAREWLGERRGAWDTAHFAAITRADFATPVRDAAARLERANDAITARATALGQDNPVAVEMQALRAALAAALAALAN